MENEPTWPTYEHTDGIMRYFPEDFTLHKTRIVAAWRYWFIGNKRAGASSNSVVRPYKDIPIKQFDGLALTRLRRHIAVWKRTIDYLCEKLDTLPNPMHAWRLEKPTHHRTIMMLSQVIPEPPPKARSTVRRTTISMQSTISYISPR